jgi:type IV pilus assembly protein PilM
MDTSSSPAAKSDSEPFNPYHKWLGIRDKQTPPNHYRLLGLELWETDEDVIREAYSRQMNHVRHFWIGPHRDLCQQILDELLAARDTLLDAQLRRPYDRWLKLVRNEADAQTSVGTFSPRQPFSVHVAPPAAVVGAAPVDVQCARCGTDNASSRRFCAGCGESLWEACIECAVPCGPGDVHCGGCGVNLSAAIQRRVEEFQSRLNQAMELHRQRDYDQAIEVLEVAMLRDHPRLAGYRKRAEQMIAQSRAEIDHLEQAAKTALADGEKLLQQGEFERAALIFEQLPQRLLTEPMKQFLVVIRDRQVESLSLITDIRLALNEKRIEGLLAKVDQLLKLQPNHTEARKLHERLSTLESNKIKSQRAKLCESAKSAIQSRDYDKATKLLEQIPQDYRSPEIAQLLEKVSLRAAESEWLRRDLRQAVIYDEHLLPLAERLLKLQPEDTFAKKCIESLRQQSKLSTAERCNSEFAWPRLPPKGRGGFPINVLKGFHGIAIEQNLSDVNSNPEHYCVAIGLALQGLERSALTINLAPREKRGILDILNEKRSILDILKSKQGFTAAWGIDFGRTALKAVKLTYQPQSEELLVTEAMLIPTQLSVDHTATEIVDQMQHSLASFLDQAELGECAICVSLPAEKVITRVVDIPASDETKTSEIMQYEVKQQIPLPLETVAWDYQVLDSTKADDAENTFNEYKVAVIGAKLDDVQAQLSVFNDRGIKVDLVQSDCAALFNFLAYEFITLKLKAKEALGSSHTVLAIVDIGSTSSNIVVTDGSIPFMRSIHLGGNEFTRTLSKQRCLTWTDAEKLKRFPSAAPFVHQIYEALESNFHKLDTEIRQSIDQYLALDNRRTLYELLVVGESSKLHGLLEYLCIGH